LLVVFTGSLLIFSSCRGGGGGTNPTYTVTYDGNGNTSGSVPIDTTKYVQGQIVTVLGNIGNLLYTCYSFSGWNLKADGLGTTFAPGQTFPMGEANVTLYAQWTINPVGAGYIGLSSVAWSGTQFVTVGGD
jgi:uncharacterized repeat protein (TIGR02543 family)